MPNHLIWGRSHVVAVCFPPHLLQLWENLHAACLDMNSHLPCLNPRQGWVGCLAYAYWHCLSGGYLIALLHCWAPTGKGIVPKGTAAFWALRRHVTNLLACMAYQERAIGKTNRPKIGIFASTLMNP